MSEGFIADLLAAQKELPALQKSAINPHFRNRYIPLEELIAAVVPVLNKHNFVLLQMPTTTEGQPALMTALIHTSGERVDTTMLLLCAKDDPQGQGSAITYARRYSLMGMLGMSADADDDAQSTVRNGHAPIQGGETRAAPPPAYAQAAEEGEKPSCPQGHGPMKFWPGAKNPKSGKFVPSKWQCTVRTCDSGNGYPESIWADKWDDHLNQKKQLAEPVGAMVDPNDIPFE